MARPNLPQCRLVLFVLLNVADLVLTWLLIRHSQGQVYESNPVANWLLTRWGWLGLSTFKLGAVMMVGALSLIIASYRPRAGGLLLSFGCSALLLVVLYSSSLAACIEGPAEGVEPDQMRQVAERKEWLDGERGRMYAYRALRRQLAEDVALGRCTLKDAVARLADSERGRDRRWLENLHKCYPNYTDEECLAANLVAFIGWSGEKR
jgi:hypothetical protein